MDIAIIIGLIASISSIVTPLVLISYWKGQVDTKITTLWDVYTASVLIREKQRHNPPVRPPLEIPDDVREQMQNLKLNSHVGSKGFSIVQMVTVEKISVIALTNNIGFGEVVASLVMLLAKEKD